MSKTEMEFFLLFLLSKVIVMPNQTIDIESLQNRLLKVCYVPTASDSLPRTLFLLLTINITNEAKQGRQYMPLSSLYYLDVYRSVQVLALVPVLDQESGPVGLLMPTK